MADEPQCRDASPEECRKTIEEGACRIIDVRTPTEFRDGHLRDAVNIDYYAPDFKARIGELNPGETYVVYCKRGMRGQKAMEIMRQAGFSRVLNVAGGFEAWSRSGQPVHR